MAKKKSGGVEYVWLQCSESGDFNYRTPVNVFRRGDRYLFALTYGPQSEWVHNVLAAGGCTLVRRGRRLALTEPRRFRDPRRRDMPWIVRIGLGVLNVSEFLELRRASSES